MTVHSATIILLYQAGKPLHTLHPLHAYQCKFCCFLTMWRTVDAVAYTASGSRSPHTGRSYSHRQLKPAVVCQEQPWQGPSKINQGTTSRNIAGGGVPKAALARPHRKRKASRNNTSEISVSHLIFSPIRQEGVWGLVILHSGLMSTLRRDFNSAFVGAHDGAAIKLLCRHLQVRRMGEFRLRNLCPVLHQTPYVDLQKALQPRACLLFTPA